ncbi:MAG: hypothetical protein LBK65_01680 [Tannerellaceae bacterium]|jgi:hypothetical protein|nr:hypothetical protein [Tannerellaceae bacterium]
MYVINSKQQKTAPRRRHEGWCEGGRGREGILQAYQETPHRRIRRRHTGASGDAAPAHQETPMQKAIAPLTNEVKGAGLERTGIYPSLPDYGTLLYEGRFQKAAGF